MAENVQVAVRLRPLSSSEQSRGCMYCIEQLAPDQILVNNANPFTFDHVYTPDSLQEDIYYDTISPLIDKLYEGFNCTVLAYGQTGSGKTYTMGTNYLGGGEASVGMIPRCITDIFERLDNNLDISANITCSFMELYQEEVYDLLTASGKPLDIREANKVVEIPSLTEVPVDTPQDAADCLIEGSGRRATGSTAMNETSSRSHAIFTLNLTIAKGSSTSAVKSKLHLVDLAGSERVNKTKATGERFKEGVKINQGLLCLGNVISALAAGQKTVSFRESKLTRVLQSSLGGNSITLMIACVSAADYNLDETLSTLRYADRAKQIKNKPVVNRDPHSQEIARLNDIILRLRNQLAIVSQSGEGNADSSRMRVTSMMDRAADEKMKVANGLLISEVAALQVQMHNLDTMRDGLVEAVDKLESQAKELDEMIGQGRPPADIQSAIVELMSRVAAMKVLLAIESDETVWHDAPSRDSLENSEAGQTFLISNQIFTADMKRLKDELTMKEHLAKKLMDNLVPEAESNASIADFLTRIAELEAEKEALLQQKVKAKPDVAAKLAEERRKKNQLLEKEIEALKKKITKHEKLIDLHKNKQKNLDNLQTEIRELKQQKVQLVKNMRKDQDKYRQLKIKSDKEMNVLREKEKKRFHEMKKLEAQHQRQKQYLQRRVEEANIKARRAENLLNRQRRTRPTSILREPAEIEKRLNQELEIIYFISEVKASLTILMDARTQLTNELQELDVKVPEEAARAALLEAEISERTHSINELQQKVQSYDMAAKVALLAKEVQADEAVKILIDQVSEMRKEHYEDHLKWEAADNLLKTRLEQMEEEAEGHRKQLLLAQKEKDEKIAILLENYWEEGGSLEEKMRPITVDLLAEVKELREENEKLKEEVQIAQRVMLKKGNKRPANKYLRHLQAQDDMEPETDAQSDYDSDRDPNWSFTEEANSLRKRSARDTTISLPSNLSALGNSSATSTSAVMCGCKTDCSRKTCGCRKKGRFCSKKCSCVQCVNKHQEGSQSDEPDVSKLNGNVTGESQEEEQEETDEDAQMHEMNVKKMRLETQENVDINNTLLKYPYAETKPVFYS